MTTKRQERSHASERVIELDSREKQIREDYQWVLRDGTVQRQQAGKVVAVHRKKIWGVGATRAAALAAARVHPECPSQRQLALVYVEGQPIA